MKPGNTPWHPVPAASLEWGDDGNPRSQAFGDVYYSLDDGPAESRYVFLRGNDIPQRWGIHPDPLFTIAETGFGTGLNFLLTWEAWRRHHAPRPNLHFLSIEKYPLTRGDLERATLLWPELASLAEELLQQYPGQLPGQHRLLFDEGAVILDLWWADAGEALKDIVSRQQAVVDAWYLDGFAPARNNAMWDDPVLTTLSALSKPGASFATFTAAGQVRRRLKAGGFKVDKVPGFGRKRECLRGKLDRHPSPIPRVEATPWDLPEQTPSRPNSALVIGAGLAGCHVANALARRGVTVTLLDRDRLASAGSGNVQGVLYTRMSTKHSPLTDFALQSFHFASNFYREMFRQGKLREGIDGALCGSFHQSGNTEELAALAKVLAPVPELAQVLDVTRANAVLGITQSYAGYWFPTSGWLHPAAVCRRLVEHGNITLQENHGALRVARRGQTWCALHGENVVAQADCAVIATGTGSNEFTGLEWLPLQSIRGQTTRVAGNKELSALRTVLCHEGYIPPASMGEHCIGATFDLDSKDEEISPRDHRENIARLTNAVPAWTDVLASLDPSSLRGRVGFRCASPDYLPLAGPVPDRAAFLHDYRHLSKNARRIIQQKGQYMPNLYLSTGHGSRGLTSTPLAAELLASVICAEAPPLDRTLCRALAPARFLIRDLIRGRI